MISKYKRPVAAIIVSTVFGLTAWTVLAQDGTSIPSSSPTSSVPSSATPAAVATATPRAMPSQPAPAPSTSVVPQPALALPIATSSAPTTTTEIMPVTQNDVMYASSDNDTGVFGLAAVIGGVTILVGAAASALRMKKKIGSKTKEEDQKDDDTHCLDLKKRMEKKLQELTDLRGQLTDKAKDKGREKIRKTVAGTAAGELLKRSEFVEKEYARFKMLYEQCIAGVGAKKRVFIIHGWEGRPDQHWLPWMQHKLEAAGFKVYALSMPGTDTPTIDAWVSHLAKNVGKPDRNTFFIGHSIGCQAILRYLEQLPDNDKVGKAVFVAGWFTLTNMETEEEKKIAKPWLETPIDFGKVQKHTKDFFALFSDNDPNVPLSDKKLFEQRLGAQTAVLSGKGHFTEDDGVTELPIVLEQFIK